MGDKMDLNELSLEELQNLKKKRWDDNQEKIERIRAICVKISSDFGTDIVCHKNMLESRSNGIGDRLYIKLANGEFYIQYKQKMMMDTGNKLFNPGNWTELIDKTLKVLNEKRRQELIEVLTLTEDE